MNLLFVFVGLLVGYFGSAMILFCRRISIIAIRIMAILAIVIAVGALCCLFPEHFWVMLISSAVCMAGSLFAISMVAVT